MSKLVIILLGFVALVGSETINKVPCEGNDGKNSKFGALNLYSTITNALKREIKKTWKALKTIECLKFRNVWPCVI